LIEEGNDYPFIIVSPQCPIYSEWDGQVTALAALLEDIQAEYAVDPGRIYVTGLSMGGYGTWAFASAYPDIPAAIVPVASFYNDPLTGVEGGVPTNICDLKDIPTWVFHGGRDEVFDKEVAEVIIEALEVCGGEPRYTLYPDADHEATFNNAYTDPELFEWLLAQSK
jgi:predicted peptidase